MLSELHATSSSLKVFCTDIAANGIEVCRRTCGGHGYLLSSGLPTLLTTYLQSVTVEGDNNLLPQQAVKFLLSALDAAHKGEVIPDSCSYLVSFVTNPGAVCDITAPDLMLSFAVLQAALDYRAGHLTSAVRRRIHRLMDGGMNHHEAWIQSLVEIGRASSAHAAAHLFRSFALVVSSGCLSSVTLKDQACLAALSKLCSLHGACVIEAELGDWLEGGYLSALQVCWLRDGIHSLLVDLANNAVALVDAWEFHDRQLQSTLGRWDGRVYEELLSQAKDSPLNDMAPDSYRNLLRPLGQPSARL
jgi:hypothetical protein